MHVLFVPETPEFWYQYYQETISQQPQYQLGNGMPIYQGYTSYQRGYGIGNFFKGLFRMAMPLFKSAAKTVGKQALASGANFAADVVQGRDPKEALMDHGKQAVSTLLNKAANRIQAGNGLGVRPRASRKPIKRTLTHRTPSVTKKKSRRVVGSRKAVSFDIFQGIK